MDEGNGAEGTERCRGRAQPVRRHRTAQAKEKVNEYPQRTFRYLLRRVPEFEQGMDDGDRLRPVGDVEEDRGDEDFPGVGCEGLWM